ncbi:Myc-type basic helix-loop-helix (bHLH) domain-containing protein [Dioscorea alata]|uniref:Myc-type basic helix-loop-helix (BHLH) domain-containing protein n=1 Tax=Dioscorea alata TaxID=55571 RepID=A0ACB7W0K1_DIOAL|nr:Myc-type basic helix-loop-helix (bHLH) domain-containing protein [Dioscorea alata]
MESTTNSPNEGYPLLDDDKLVGKGSSSSKPTGAADQSDDHEHEMHIWTERERRKKMRTMFSNLHALLPNLPPKADKSSIVDEAVNYINSLQQTINKLQKQKMERVKALAFEENQTHGAESTREVFLAEQGKNMVSILGSPTSASFPRFPLNLQTWSSQNLVLSITGEDAHINICTGKKPGLLSTICFIMEKHNLELVSAHISSDHFRTMIMIHARATGISDQFPEAMMIEEIYKLAVGEIIMCLPS